MEDNKISLTDPQTIIAAANEKLESFKDARAKLNQISIKYTDAIDNAYENNLKDGTLLRKRMKLAVIRATTDNELQ